MLYCLAIGLAFIVVGYALERALHYAGRPTRWAWVIALVGSYLIPVAAWLRPEAFATFAVPVPPAVESSGTFATPAVSTTSTIQPASPPFSIRDLDRPLAWGWGLASIALVLVLGIAATRLVSMQRRWRRAAVDGRQAFVSPNVGPAVVGVWSPQVVLPEWALQLPDRERELMLAHEEQHVRAADPALIAMGFVLALLAPWNLALWWQWRRLRLAVEMDCDARVLSQGRSAPAYGELLLRVGRRRSTQMVGLAAFGEPVSFLELRIRRMLATSPRWRWAGVVAAIAVTVAAIVGACEAPRPVGPARESVQSVAASRVTFAGVVSVETEPRDPAEVDQAVAVLVAPTMAYPDLPRLAGINGPVVVQARIETSGRANPSSITVLESPHPAYAEAAKSAVLRSLFRPAQAHGRPVAALARITYQFGTLTSTAQTGRELSDRLALQSARLSLQQAEELRPWIASNARRMFPSILEPSGPPMDAFLVHESRLSVYRGTLTTLNYLGNGGSRPNQDIDVAELKQALPSFSPGHDGWGVVDPRGLRGLVRDNVRVIRINHDPQPQDTTRQSSGALSVKEIDRRAEHVRRLARQ